MSKKHEVTLIPGDGIGPAITEATLRMLDDDPDTVLPSTLMDAFVKTTAKEVLEPFLSRLFEKTFDD